MTSMKTIFSTLLAACFKILSARRMKGASLNCLYFVLLVFVLCTSCICTSYFLTFKTMPTRYNRFLLMLLLLLLRRGCYFVFGMIMATFAWGLLYYYAVDFNNCGLCNLYIIFGKRHFPPMVVLTCKNWYIYSKVTTFVFSYLMSDGFLYVWIEFRIQ